MHVAHLEVCQFQYDAPILQTSDQVRPMALPSNTHASTPTATASIAVSVFPKKTGSASAATASAAKADIFHSRGGSIDPVQGCQMAKFDPFLSLDCARVEGGGGAIQGKKGIKLCSVA